jgi:hypothetical protein
LFAAGGYSDVYRGEMIDPESSKAQVVAMKRLRMYVGRSEEFEKVRR